MSLAENVGAPFVQVKIRPSGGTITKPSAPSFRARWWSRLKFLGGGPLNGSPVQCLSSPVPVSVIEG